MLAREEEFLHQIRLHPDEDNIRLIFADWLDEIGDERAELIRVQCECARLPPTPAEPASPHDLQLKSHEAELAELWRKSCLEQLASLGIKDVRFVRGFVERVHVEGTEFLNRAKTLSEWAPAIRGVLWQKLPRQSAQAIQRFFGSPVFSCIATLNLMRNNLGPSGLEALAKSPGLGRIQSLSLRENPVGGQGMQELMNSAHLVGLKRFDLTDTQLSPVDARNLVRNNSLHQLEELLLNHNQIGDVGVRAVANSSHLGTLRQLAVADNHIAQEGLRAIADSAYLTDLHSLDLSGNEIGDTGVSFMASAANFARLCELNLSGCGIHTAGLANLAESPYFLRLTSLNLSHNPLSKGLHHLLESRLIENLQVLSLRNCHLDSQSLRTLSGKTPPLRKLDLQDNPLINHYTRETLKEQFGEAVSF